MQFSTRIQEGIRTKKNSDLFIGRRFAGMLRNLGFEDFGVHYASPDSVNTPTEIFRFMFQEWSEGYAHFIHEATGIPVEEAEAHFQAYIDDLSDTNGYVVWHCPVYVVRNPE